MSPSLTSMSSCSGINAIRSLYMCEVAGLRNDACLFLDETKQDPEQLQAFRERSTMALSTVLTEF
ncbi:hypothetical protein, variant [Phytophthora nicotianae INRA-310]|uniref:Uncharacterized protein n=1 Tax=Phytophthora nicotianae (strain INRA-310) TaxID=761204 RepID=W2R0F7_PHYN3|nr:hypothetical protein PPTG_21593 [Phytophthora nicotianae INRA-310]XP_008896654.1 hypothetical protein, variant [Phytophthora nicotianae INRA-310]ETN18725.1 hypothetical protein PPTG_21593 [Phytophthora nicotianae INRA-310]ETN18726.1 hypothetical protein, variant [Phytophthora nicotianae INRA-310]